MLSAKTMINKPISNSQSKFYQVKQPTEAKQIIELPASPVESPSKWLKDGSSPAEIILASAILVFSVSSVIIAIAHLLSRSKDSWADKQHSSVEKIYLLKQVGEADDSNGDFPVSF
ncbi:hypothetical protein [Mastigocoleus testarum]|uniref:Uncharacterized protein n=1 Tax=Mastigocoleus testarum BC008 TaxID=371196 RepID=A0A0V7ZSJ5_9CYAN|nr:hypothetical protein [Mastigocoleus testarum]KST67450.1 hypothetical protein BC008_30085 [Mastigocoleus testarum BC008]